MNNDDDKDLADDETKTVSTKKASEEFSGDSSDDDLNSVEWNLNETTSYVILPMPGVSLATMEASREVPNGCAICLSEFEVEDRVTWSANAECLHVFHEDCLLKWMLSVGRKSREQQLNDANSQQDAVEAATDFPMLCPCCRQQFISTTRDSESDQVEQETDNSLDAESHIELPQVEPAEIARAPNGHESSEDIV